MTDINDMIVKMEEELGRSLTDEEKRAANALATLLSFMWSKGEN